MLCQSVAFEGNRALRKIGTEIHANNMPVPFPSAGSRRRHAVAVHILLIGAPAVVPLDAHF